MNILKCKIIQILKDKEEDFLIEIKNDSSYVNGEVINCWGIDNV